MRDILPRAQSDSAIFWVLEKVYLPLMYENWSRSKRQKSRSQGHATYQQQERNNSAVDGHINFKLGAVGKNKKTEVEIRRTFSL